MSNRQDSCGPPPGKGRRRRLLDGNARMSPVAGDDATPSTPVSSPERGAEKEKREAGEKKGRGGGSPSLAGAPTGPAESSSAVVAQKD